MKKIPHIVARICIIVAMFLVATSNARAQAPACIPTLGASALSFTCGIGTRVTNISIAAELGTFIKDTNMTCMGAQYHDNVATDSLVVIPGGMYKADMDMDTPSVGANDHPSAIVWIDFDNDGIFSPSEVVGGFSNPLFIGMGDYSRDRDVNFYFNIPATAAAGTYRMRVHVEHIGPGGDYHTMIHPCFIDRGDAFDYKVRVGCAAAPGGYTITVPASVCAASSVPFASSAPGGGWRTSNIAIATVDPAGNVTGTGLGLDTIIYSIADGSGCIATAMQTVSVLSALSQGPDLISQFYPAQVTNVLPGGAWSSSNTAIATVVPGPGGDTAIVTGGTTLGPVTIYYTTGGCVSPKYMLNTYCVPGYTGAPTDNCGFGYYLTSLLFTGEAATSINDASIDCLEDGSSDRSATAGSASVLAGNTYNITITTPETGGIVSSYYVIYTAVYQNVAVFADFANDGIYSTAQVIGGLNAVVSNSSTANTYTFPVTIPAGTAPGTYHIRVRSASNGTAPIFTEMDGCSNYYVGVAMNYTINVLCVPPTISCTGGNIVTSNDPGNCSAIVSSFPAETTTGSPSVITYSPAAGSAFAVGVTTVTATATNSCGSATCNFSVSVNDTDKPVITVTDTTLSGCVPVAITLHSPATSDNCGIASVANNWPGGPFPVGTTNVTWTVTDIHSNTATAVQHVTVSPATLSISAVVHNISCRGGSNGSITTTPGGGTSPYACHWSTGATTTGISGLHIGTYSVTVTDAHSCTAIQSYTIGQPATALAASATGGTIACHGGATTVSVSGTGGTSPYTGTGTIAGVAAGAHTFTVTDNNGCTATASITLTQPATALTAIAASPTSIACYGGTTSVSVTATGGVAPYAGAGTIAGVAAGAHTYTVTDHAGCTASASITVTQPAQVVATATAGTIACSGGTTSVSVAAAGGTSPYTGTGTFAGVGAGAHTYTVTDHKGCTGSASVSLTQPAALNINAAVINVGCGSAGSITTVASGGTAPYTYSWSNGSHAASLTGLSAGTYTLTLTDAHGCHTTGTYTVGAAASLAISGVVANPDCHGNSTGSICAAISGGSPAYSYSWSNGAHTATIAGLAAGTYTLTVTDAHGCSAAHSFTVSQPALLAVTATVTNASCYGCSNGGINTGVSGGTAPYTYLWSNGSHLAHPTSLAAGTYAVTVTDAHGCTVTASYTVSQPAKGHSGARSSGNGNETVTTDDIKIYPNPAQDELNVAIPVSEKEAVITIMDLDGKTIEKRTVSGNDGQPVQFSLASVPRGIYIVRVVAGNISYVGKVIAK